MRIENESIFQEEKIRQLMKLVEEVASGYLKKGRDWDLEHTKIVVEYTLALAREAKKNDRIDTDFLVLAVAAWFS